MTTESQETLVEEIDGPEEDAQATPEPPAPEEAPDEPSAEVADEPSTEAGPELGPGEECSDDELLREAAALLFASPDPLSPGRLRNLLLCPHPKRIGPLLERLGEELERSPLPVVLRRIAGGWRLLTDPADGEVVHRLQKEARPERITAAALETLAIVAYRQPVTKAEIEAIRGVQVGAILRSLVDRGLARVTGRASLPGSPLQYGTTKEFLDRFGLASLKDLPRDGELTES
jgi:segregation and condensation protein B